MREGVLRPPRVADETLLADRLPTAPASPILATTGEMEISALPHVRKKTPEPSLRGFRF